MNIDKLKENATLIGYAGCIIAIISLFLPFVTVEILGYSESTAYIEGDGKLVILGILVSAGLMVIKKGKYSWIATGISLLILLITLIDGFGNIREYKEFYHFSIGLYTLFIGLILMGAYGYLYDPKKDNCKWVVNNFPANSNTNESKQEETSGESRFCRDCGNKLKKDSKFCSKCGKEQ